MSRTIAGWVVVLVSALCASTVDAQSATVVVAVRSDADEPLVDAMVTLVHARLHARTDSGGVARFLVPVAAGRDTLRVRRLGFDPKTVAVTVPSRDTLRVTISLVSRVVRLSEIDVKELATLSWFEEFDRRRARGQGRFITREELDKEHGSEIGSIIMRRFPGVRVSGKSWIHQTLFSTRGPKDATGARCQVPVFIDGVRVPTGNIAEVPPSLIGAVEYYTPSIVPVQYRSAESIGGDASPACGVLLMWTR